MLTNVTPAPPSPTPHPPLQQTPPSPEPLLPAFLTKPGAILGLWVAPIALLLALNARAFDLIEGNLSDGERARALLVGGAGAANLLCGLGFFLWLRIQKVAMAEHARHQALTGAIIMAVQVAYLWFASASMDVMIPRSVSLWIYPEERYLFHQFAFGMIPLFLGLLWLACIPTNSSTLKTVALNLGWVVGGPLFLYVAGNIVFRLGGLRHLPSALVAACFVIFGIALFAGLVRALALIFRSASSRGRAWERPAIVIFALVLPLAGLVLNRSIPFPVTFQSWEVYALTVTNALILLAACELNATRPRLSVALLGFTFPFTLYFFVVFLPYTPLSLPAMLAMGAGFLVLTPTCLFVLHLNLLLKSGRSFHLSGRTSHVLALGVTAALILPALVVTRALADRTALNAALTHVYSPSPTADNGDLVYPGSVRALRRALNSHEYYKSGLHYPLLSDFYSWFVFNNLILPDTKIDEIEKRFFGTGPSPRGQIRGADRSFELFGSRGHTVRDLTGAPRARPVPHTVAVSALEVRPRSPASRQADAETNLSLTHGAASGHVDAAINLSPIHGATISLSLIHTDPSSGTGAEYVTRLPLPTGVYVDGLRLTINGEAAPGRIVEKKTALWIYTSIRDRERRDPAILFYSGPQELELRVFPVMASAPTHLEIDFVTPAPVTRLTAALPHGLDPAAALALLKNDAPYLADSRHGTVLTGAIEALPLPANPLPRSTYLHVIVDRSAEHAFRGDLTAALAALRAEFPRASTLRLSLANHDVITLTPERVSFTDLPRRTERDLRRLLPVGGGLAIDYAIADGLRRNQEIDLDSPSASEPPPRPIFVLLGNASQPRTFDLDLARRWSDMAGGIELYERTASGQLVPAVVAAQSPIPTGLLRLGHSIRPCHPDREIHFAAGDEGQSLFAWDATARTWTPLTQVKRAPADSFWAQAAGLQALQHTYDRMPGSATSLRQLLHSTKTSGVLTTAGSYIVVENAAQWKQMERSEKQKLSQHAALAFVETPAPPALWVGLGFILWAAARKPLRSILRKRKPQITQIYAD